MEPRPNPATSRTLPDEAYETCLRHIIQRDYFSSPAATSEDDSLGTSELSDEQIELEDTLAEVSLDGFLRTFSSEEKDSFSTIVKKDQRRQEKRIIRFAGLDEEFEARADATATAGGKKVRKRIRGRKKKKTPLNILAITAGQSGSEVSLSESGSQEEEGFNRALILRSEMEKTKPTLPHEDALAKIRNSLMFFPDSRKSTPAPPQPSHSDSASLSAGMTFRKTIDPANTRISSEQLSRMRRAEERVQMNPQQPLVLGDKAVSSTGARVLGESSLDSELDELVRRRMQRENESYDLDDLARNELLKKRSDAAAASAASGLGRLATPFVKPTKDNVPITWGSVQGTPMRLVDEEEALMRRARSDVSGSGPKKLSAPVASGFRIHEPTNRERLAQRMADSSTGRKRTGRGKRPTSIFAPYTPRSELLSALTPAGRRLASVVARGRSRKRLRTEDPVRLLLPDRRKRRRLNPLPPGSLISKKN